MKGIQGKIIAVSAVLMIILGIMGSRRIESRKGVILESVREEEAVRQEEAVREQTFSKLDQWKDTFQTLLDFMEQEKWTDAAKLLEEQKEELSDLYYDSMDGNPFLFDGEFHEGADGKGLVMKKGNILFYGEFKNGMPEGKGSAMMAVSLENPRYDYSSGTFQDGMMEGKGETGFFYYEGVKDQQVQAVKREGVFHQDQMDGQIIYTSTNALGEQSAWDMTVKEGVLQLDDRWIRQEEKGEYRLLAEGDPGHAYVAPETALSEVRWINMIPWE